MIMLKLKYYTHSDVSGVFFYNLIITILQYYFKVKNQSFTWIVATYSGEVTSFPRVSSQEEL